MIKESKLYITMSYILFILPPFIWGLVEIYSMGNNDNPQIISLIVNILIYAIGSTIIYVLIKKQKTTMPTSLDYKHLLFGLIGNITIFFYTFQTYLHIENFITIYLVLLIVLVVYYLFFSKRFSPMELWIIVPIFLIIDILHLVLTGCGFMDGYTCFRDANTSFTYLLYIIMVFTIILVYIHKIIELRPSTVFKYVNIVLVVMVSFMIQDIRIYDSRFFGTLMIAIPFFIILEFIITIVNKTYTHKTLIFYLRTSTLFFVMTFLNEMNFFSGEANYEILILMIAITYTSLFITILSFLLKVNTEINPIKSKIKFFIDIEEYQNIKLNKETEILFIQEQDDTIIDYLIASKVNKKLIEIKYKGDVDIKEYLSTIETVIKRLGYTQINIIAATKQDILENYHYPVIELNNTYYYLKKL